MITPPKPAALTAPQSPSSNCEELLQPLHRIDQAHQWLAELDQPSVDHVETISAATLGSNAALAKDSPSAPPLVELSPRPAAHAIDAAVNVDATEEGDSTVWAPERMLQAHAADLIAFLQTWSDDLDQRSAKLNADIATQERRERSFRMWMQQRQAELNTEREGKRHDLVLQQADARRAFFEATETGLRHR